MNLVRFKSPSSSAKNFCEKSSKTNVESNQINDCAQRPNKIKQRSSRKTSTTIAPCPHQSVTNKAHTTSQENDNVWILRDNCKTNIPIASSRIPTKKSKCVHYAPFLTQG